MIRNHGQTAFEVFQVCPKIPPSMVIDHGQTVPDKKTHTGDSRIFRMAPQVDFQMIPTQTKPAVDLWCEDLEWQQGVPARRCGEEAFSTLHFDKPNALQGLHTAVAGLIRREACSRWGELIAGEEAENVASHFRFGCHGVRTEKAERPEAPRSRPTEPGRI